MLKTKAMPKKRSAPISDGENSDHASDNDNSLLSSTPPSAKRQKKAPAPKKAPGKPLQEIDNESFGLDETDGIRPSGSKVKKEQYQKVPLSEPVLLALY